MLVVPKETLQKWNVDAHHKLGRAKNGNNSVGNTTQMNPRHTGAKVDAQKNHTIPDEFGQHEN